MQCKEADKQTDRKSTYKKRKGGLQSACTNKNKNKAPANHNRSSLQLHRRGLLTRMRAVIGCSGHNRVVGKSELL